MFEGFDLGSLWLLKDNSNSGVHRVIGHSAGLDLPEVSIIFDCNDEMVTYKKQWVLENMVPAV